MKDAQPIAIKLDEYRVPVYLVDETHLDFDIKPECTEVSSRLVLRRNPKDESSAAGIVFDGQDLQLLKIELDGRPLGDNEYQVSDNHLEVFNLPDSCELGLVTRIYPEKNTALEGLYKSGMYCTQCEAEGFRKITYYPDRPDVLSRFTTTIIADDTSYPTMLSNGNRVNEHRQSDGRLAVTWHDPFPKPSYLFALVAGDLALLEDEFTTGSNRKIALRIYSEAHNIDQCGYAMDALKRAMRWDEEVFGREYDLDNFMIVAVDDFNMGAMENKGLNIFNTSCVLASADTATDVAYERVEAVVAHEYFHNWSGNRVTCRDWFQLSLKEGFTVFRDAEFSSDMNSRTVKRIEDVNFLRTVQFAEDAGPLAHPIRPDSYIEISNFYTTTIYEKGAEVVRMIHTLLGAEQFRAGSDLYFARHDGDAVTTEDFVQAMEDATGVDLQRFRRWYNQAGTPRIQVQQKKSPSAIELVIQQDCPPTPGQQTKLPFHIPLRLGFLGADGKDLLGSGINRIELSSDADIVLDPASSSCLLHLKETETCLDITTTDEQGAEDVVVSLLRGYSAPIIVDFPRDSQELYFLAANDSDGFARWDAKTRIFCDELEALRKTGVDAPASAQVSEPLVALVSQLISQSLKARDDGEAKAMLAGMLTTPEESYLHEQMPIIDVDGIAVARKRMRSTLGERLFDDWHRLYLANTSSDSYVPGGVQSACRKIKAVALSYMAVSSDMEHAGIVRSLVYSLVNDSDNLTDRLLGLRLGISSPGIADSERSVLLDEFYTRWKQYKLVVNQWISVQSTCAEPGALQKVEQLEQHESYDLKNPNCLRSLYGGFSVHNHQHFHNVDGSGYRFLAERIKQLDSLNPQLAARLVAPLTRWKRYDKSRQRVIKAVLLDLQAHEGENGSLSRDVFELISKSLTD